MEKENPKGYQETQGSEGADLSPEELEAADSFRKTETDEEGPFVIALRAEKTLPDNGISKGVILAVELMFTEDADSIVPGNNVKTFGNIIGTLVEQESTILIPVKPYLTGITFSTRSAAIAGLLSIVIIPVCLLLTGFVVWFRRRKA